VTCTGRALVNRAVVSVEACDTAFFATLGSEAAAFRGCLAALKLSASHPPGAAAEPGQAQS
jgi:hypothetical protein